MSNPLITGQTLLDALKINLGGLSNAFTVDQQLYFINEGVNEVWAIVKNLDQDYFGGSSQDTTAAADDYFLDLTVDKREYDLPKNCRELRSIEVITANFADRVFEYRLFDNPEFQAARRQATAQGVSVTTGMYLYTVFGTQFLLAQYPEAVLQLKLWYIKSIDEVDQVNGIPEILYPFDKKIVDYATKRAIAATQNVELSLIWKQQWDESVKTLAISVPNRSSTNAIFVSDFLG